jgi:hypothetical protein
MKRRTILVEGPFAFRMRLIVAAREAGTGVQIMTVPTLPASSGGRFHEGGAFAGSRSLLRRTLRRAIARIPCES